MDWYEGLKMARQDTAGIVGMFQEIRVPAAEMSKWDALRIQRFFYGVSVAIKAASDADFGAIEALCLDWAGGAADVGTEQTVPMLKTIGAGSMQFAKVLQQKEQELSAPGLVDGAGI